MSELNYQFRYALPLWLIEIATGWLPENRVSQRIRGRMMEAVLHCQGGLKVAKSVILVNVQQMRLGRDVYIGPGAWVNGLGGLTLEDEVMLGPYVCIATTEHGFRDGSVRAGGTHLAPVKIGRGTWLAAHVVVTPGVSIGAGCLVAANAVVTGDVADDRVMAGVPARDVGARTDNPGPLSRRSG